MKSLFEQNGGTYSVVGDYLIPDLVLPPQSDYVLGRYGRLNKEYLKEHKIGFYTGLVLSGKLSDYLMEIDIQAKDKLGTIMKDLAKKQNITEQLKATDQFAWVGAMNNIKACAEEIVLSEIIYD